MTGFEDTDDDAVEETPDEGRRRMTRRELLTVLLGTAGAAVVLPCLGWTDAIAAQHVAPAAIGEATRNMWPHVLQYARDCFVEEMTGFGLPPVMDIGSIYSDSYEQLSLDIRYDRLSASDATQQKGRVRDLIHLMASEAEFRGFNHFAPEEIPSARAVEFGAQSGPVRMLHIFEPVLGLMILVFTVSGRSDRPEFYRVRNLKRAIKGRIGTRLDPHRLPV